MSQIYVETGSGAGWRLVRRVASAWTWLCALAVLSTACASGGGARRPKFVGQAAQGRPATCPDGAVDPNGNGVPGPDDMRCSYNNASGGAVLQVRGSVLTEPSGATPGAPVRDVEIVVLDASGQVIARGTADAQGSFSVGALLRAGQYRIALAEAPATARTFDVGPDGPPESIVLIVPRPVDPRD